VIWGCCVVLCCVVLCCVVLYWLACFLIFFFIFFLQNTASSSSFSLSLASSFSSSVYSSSEKKETGVKTPKPRHLVRTTIWSSVCNDHDLHELVSRWCADLGRVQQTVAVIACDFFEALCPSGYNAITRQVVPTLYDAFIRVATREWITDDELCSVVGMHSTNAEKQEQYDVCRLCLCTVAKFLKQRGYLPDPNEIVVPKHFFFDLRRMLVTNFVVSLRRFKGFVLKSLKKVLFEKTADQPMVRGRKGAISYCARDLRRQLFRREEVDISFPETTQAIASVEIKAEIVDYVNDLASSLPTAVWNLWADKPEEGTFLGDFLPLLKKLQQTLSFRLVPEGFFLFFFCFLIISSFFTTLSNT
jgi:hypothetical protein